MWYFCHELCIGCQQRGGSFGICNKQSIHQLVKKYWANDHSFFLFHTCETIIGQIMSRKLIRKNLKNFLNWLKTNYR